MAEILEPEGGAELEAGVGPISPAAAMALGVRKARTGRAADPTFDAFLEKQTHVLSLQAEHLHEQRELILSRLRWGRFSDRLKALLQALTILVGVAVAGAVALMAWQAGQDHGLSIAAFSVPPDLASRGLTGQVVAAKVLDRLAELQNQTVSERPASTYDENWGEDIKVEIPETGVSLGELNRWLRQWLGHETRITGEVVRTPAGVAVTARAGTEPGRTFAGGEADMDGLIGQAAEAVYAATQPYRYAVYLGSHGHADEALARFAWLARHGSPEDQVWAYDGWSSALLRRGDEEGVVRVVREGQGRGLTLYAGTLNTLGLALNQLSRNAEMLDASRQVLEQVRRTGRGFQGLSRDAAVANMQRVIASHYGDHQTSGMSRDLDIEGAEAAIQVRPLQAGLLIDAHDIRGALSLIGPNDHLVGYRPGVLKMQADMMLEDWAAAVAAGEPAVFAAMADPAERQVAIRRNAPTLAVAYAHAGRLADARRLLAETPLDCDNCVHAQAEVAEAAGDRAGADRWFAQLLRMNPIMPFVEKDWGRAMLARGDLDGAIAKARASHAKGPHFADALELWGEALLRKGDFDGAAAKFAEAGRYTPKWGRNHLLWGEALMLDGRFAEAHREYAIASGLDLSKPDRAALNVLLVRTGKGALHG